MMNYANIGLLFIIILCGQSVGINLDLPGEFLPYYFNAFPDVAKECSEDPQCPYKVRI